MKKNQKKSKKLMSSSILLLGLFSFFVTSAISVNAEVATLKSSLAQITVTGKVKKSFYIYVLYAKLCTLTI